eukprot:COSAG04_NODE_27756_length_280_cov_0.574586_2_plen_45_part_01
MYLMARPSRSRDGLRRQLDPELRQLAQPARRRARGAHRADAARGA